MEEETNQMTESQRTHNTECDEKENGSRTQEESLNVAALTSSDSNMDLDDSKESSRNRNYVKMKRKRLKPQKKNTSSRSQRLDELHVYCIPNEPTG